MKRRLWRLSAVLSLAVCLGLLSTYTTGHASAAEPGFNILTSSLPIKISTTPGKTVTTEIRFKNLNNTPQAIKVGLLRFGASGEEGKPDLFNLTPKDTFSNWVHFAPSEVVAQPGVWNTTTMTINVPANADLGYYMAVTFSPADADNQSGVAKLIGSAATLVLLNVNSGNEKRDLSVVQFGSSKGLYEYLPATFNVKLRNNGNIFIAPTGNIFISHGGKQVAALTFNDAGASILPQTNRTLSVNWADGFPLYKDRIVNGKTVPDSHAVPKRNLTWDFTQVNKLRFGRYTAKVLVVYDNGNQDVPIEATLNFWVLPWKALLLVIVVALVILLGIYSFVRSLIARTRGGGGKTSGYRRGRR